jgi:hypothetical protein
VADVEIICNRTDSRMAKGQAGKPDVISEINLMCRLLDAPLY